MSYQHFDSLIKWSREQYSFLPWRSNRTLYKTLVSEIMLQQTTVGTVLNHFEKFLLVYSSIFDLANASEEEVCLSWKGLGYYRRAKNLRNIAIAIVEKFQGKIPTELDLLLSLKGIGPYTANAIIAIGADKRGLAVDANLERVLARYYGIDAQKGTKLQLALYKEFDEGRVLADIEKLGARNINEALMDLGRVLCQSKKASCSLCPLKLGCVAFLKGEQLSYPVEGKKKKGEDFFLKLLRVVVWNKNKILLYQKKEMEWLAGQWELPTFLLETNDGKVKQYPELKNKKAYENLPTIKTAITKYTIFNAILEMDYDDFIKLTKTVGGEYVFKIYSDKLHISTAGHKVLKQLAEK